MNKELECMNSQYIETYKQLQDMYDTLNQLRDDIRNKEFELIFDTTGLQKSEISISSFWKCNKSPVGYCVYDNIEDSPHDHCVYCNKPEDRD